MVRWIVRMQIPPRRRVRVFGLVVKQQQQPPPQHQHHQQRQFGCETSKATPVLRSAAAAATDGGGLKNEFELGWIRLRTTRIIVVTRQHLQRQRRYMSSSTSSWWSNSSNSNSNRDRRGNNNNNNNKQGGGGRGGFQADALPFSVSPDEAMITFSKWAEQDQGLGYLLQRNAVRIGASYCPVWSFDLNLRFVVEEDVNTTTGPKKRRRFDWKPDIFSVYGSQSVIHLPGLSTYAGYSYRRSLINPLHNTTLVFLGDQTVPFAKWMLREMPMSNGKRLAIFPDPWNTTRTRALAVIKEELIAIARSSLGPQHHVQVQTEILSSRRVQMPTYVIDYKILGMEYRAFISGCDTKAGVSGVSHQVFDGSSFFGSNDISSQASSFLTQSVSIAQAGYRILGGRFLGSAIVVVLQFLASVTARLVSRIPIIGLLGGIFVGFRKIVQPWMDNRWASAEWERQREHESSSFTDESSYDHTDDFSDSGTARRFYYNNRNQILRHLAGDIQHEQGTFDWFKEWEAWARKQWEQQQSSTYQRNASDYGREQQQQQQQQQTRQQPSRQRSTSEYKWDFNPDDPYSVLGISSGSSKSDVTAAFRKQMMMYHPDTQVNATEAEKARALERSKLITDAYRKIKATMK